jgi:hypothetical protein
MSRNGILMLAAANTMICVANTTVASTPYDGNWSVIIITDRGDCDRAYRYPVQIRNGIVRYTGNVVNLSGRVANNGAVAVALSRGAQHAAGNGRLSPTSGAGTWRGASPTARCSGRWEAERRSGNQ